MEELKCPASALATFAKLKTSRRTRESQRNARSGRKQAKLTRITPFVPLVTANRSPHQCSVNQLTLHPPSLSTVPPARAFPAPLTALNPPRPSTETEDEEAAEEMVGKPDDEGFPPEPTEDEVEGKGTAPSDWPAEATAFPPCPAPAELPTLGPSPRTARSTSSRSVQSRNASVGSRHSQMRRCESDETAATLRPKWAAANETERIVPRQSVSWAVRDHPDCAPAGGAEGARGWPGVPCGRGDGRKGWCPFAAVPAPARGGGSSSRHTLTTPSTPPLASTVPNSGSAQARQRAGPSCAFHARVAWSQVGLTPPEGCCTRTWWSSEAVARCEASGEKAMSVRRSK